MPSSPLVGEGQGGGHRPGTAFRCNQIRKRSNPLLHVIRVGVARAPEGGDEDGNDEHGK